jgi:hypothetical protein
MPDGDRGNGRAWRWAEAVGGSGLAAAPALLAVLLYARHLGEGYLADDFLYLDWARAGLGVLLRHVTTDSYPQMIRPLPAVVWATSRSGSGAAILHGVSVLLHAAAGLLVAAVIRRSRRARRVAVAEAGAEAVPEAEGGPATEERWTPLAFASLFVAFPLFTEPVIWLSSSPDLWACCLALAALRAATPSERRVRPVRPGWPERLWRPGRPAAAGALYLAALLSKESVLALPLVVAALWPWRQVRRTVLLMAAAAGAYAGVRFALFAGPGGYLDSGGRSLLWSASLGGTLRNLALRLPLRLLGPFRRAGEVPLALPATLLLSTALIAAFLLAALGPGAAAPARQRALAVLARIRRPLVVFLLALLPVLPVFVIDVDQEGSRLLYFPVAAGLVALGMEAPALQRTARRLALALAVFWSLATVWNGQAWSEASREAERTLAEMARLAPGFPARSTVFVAGHDTWRGAYTWRNGIAAAARWRGLRPDVSWFLGTVAGIDAPGDDLGRTLFEIGLDDSGHAVDWTPCERALLAPPRQRLASWTLPPAAGRDPVTPELALERPAAFLQVRLGLGAERPAAAVSGALLWLPPRFGRFNTTDSAPFFFGRRAAAEVVLRVPPELAPRPAPMRRTALWLHLPARDLHYVRTLSVAEMSASCAAPPRL